MRGIIQKHRIWLQLVFLILGPIGLVFLMFEEVKSDKKLNQLIKLSTILWVIAYFDFFQIGTHIGSAVFLLYTLIADGSAFFIQKSGGLESKIGYWFIHGVLIGIVYGSYVAYKKYRLSKYYFIFTLLILILYSVLQLLLNIRYISERKNVFNGRNISNERRQNTSDTNKSINTILGYDYFLLTNYTDGADLLKLVDQDINTSLIRNSRLKRNEPFSDMRFWVELNGKKEMDFKSLILHGFYIYNGNNQSEKEWNKYGRAKKINVVINKKVIAKLDVEDVFNKPQSLFFEPVKIEPLHIIELVIMEDYQGTVNKIAISELIPIIEIRK